MEDLIRQAKELQHNLQTAAAKIDLESKRRQLVELEAQMGHADFWADRPKAAELSQQQARLRDEVGEWDKLLTQAKDLVELAKSGDQQLASDLNKQYQELKFAFEKKEFELKLSGPHDANPAILAIHAGTGGTDAMDWAQMLQRMYLRWADAHNYRAEVISQSAGEEAGIKSVLLRIDGPLVYGKLRGEHGVHRLVRKSPFNSDHLRQTSFTLVEVLPEIESAAESVIDPKDLKVETFRSGGAGGQSVNKTESAVRVTHLPTGISVSIQNERSQLQNRETALKILHGRLTKLAHQQQQRELTKLKGPNVKAEWGQQVRNYVLDPYQLVKDLRSGFETREVAKVLDGDLDGLIEAYLASRLGTDSA